MASVRAISAARSCFGRSQSRKLHQSAARMAITTMQMPAMSPTMTEGGVSTWKKKDGEAFSAGDVLVEIETDKATIDVEAQDDGVMGKILVPEGSKGIKVGKAIALLAEEGDDLSNLEAPKEDVEPPKPKQETAAAAATTPPPEASKPASPPPSEPVSHSLIHPTHSRPLFPSVYLLLAENGIADAEKIQGTGVRGMLTKGDVLAYLGKASSPTGTFKETSAQESKPAPSPAPAPAVKNEESKPLDGAAIRQLIVSTMLKTSLKAQNPPPSAEDVDFESIIADYLPPSKSTAPKVTTPPKPTSKRSGDYLDGLI